MKPKEIQELLDHGIINEDTATRIRAFYQTKESDTGANRLLTAFGVIGAILVGLGIILIISHNWDDLSRSVKTIIAFVPLVLSQILCGVTIFKKNDNTTWREVTATLLTFGVGASIAMVSQIYNIMGDLGVFMLTWLLLVLPVVYVMRSSVVSILYIVGVCFFSTYNTFDKTFPFWYCVPMILLVLPHYYQLYRSKPQSNYMYVHSWVVPLACLYLMCVHSDYYGGLFMVACTALLGFYYLLGNAPFFRNQKIGVNGYKIIGLLGTAGVFLAFTFEEFWGRGFGEYSILLTLPFIILGLSGLVVRCRDSYGKFILPFGCAFLVFTIMYFIGDKEISKFLANIFVLILGISTIMYGAKRESLRNMNFGFLIIAVLIACRFFDTEFSIIVKGILFLLVGAGFFAANYLMVKKMKNS